MLNLKSSLPPAEVLVSMRLSPSGLCVPCTCLATSSFLVHRVAAPVSVPVSVKGSILQIIALISQTSVCMSLAWTEQLVFTLVFYVGDPADEIICLVSEAARNY